MEPKAGRSACQEVREKFLDLLDENLTGEGRKEVERHLQACRDCAWHWESYCSTVQALNSLETLDVPERVFESIRARIQKGSTLRRVLGWLRVHPWRVPVPVMATLGVVLLLGGLGQWRPWDNRPQQYSPTASLKEPGVELQAHQIQPVGSSYLQENFLSPVRALDLDSDWPLAGKVMIQDEMVLDLTGSEEVFQRIESILRESRGKMFLMGVRHRDSGQVIRSRILLEIPMESYSRVIQQIESLAPVQRVFLEREALPLRPDRLRISIVAKDMGTPPEASSIQTVGSR
ncbi:MAG: anti-sigma factor family protein [Desulfobacterota bacterium U4-17]